MIKLLRLSRYRTYFGNNLILYLVLIEDCLKSEKQYQKHFKKYNICNVLFEKRVR
jgi:hypothetical protein